MTTSQNLFDELPKQYDHLAAQERWSKHWEEKGFFHSSPNPNKTPYAIVIPPPNVTGALHLGHALNNTLQDIMIRMKRMQGFGFPASTTRGSPHRPSSKNVSSNGKKRRGTTSAARLSFRESGHGKTSISSGY